MVDLHAHLLPAIPDDDGPRTMRDALTLARAFVAMGTGTVVCTPHLLAEPDAVLGAMAEGVVRLREELARAGTPLEVLPGAEVGIGMAARLSDDELRAASLGGTGRWILLEMPFRGWPLVLPSLIHDLEVRGFSVVLAHPERAESVQLSPDRLRDALGRGALVQITAGSLTGEHGPRARRAAEHLLREGMAHVMASDAHAVGWRPPGMAGGLEAAARVLRRGVEELSWMVDEGPRAIAAGREVRAPRLGPATRRRPDARPDSRGSARSPRR